VGQSRKEAYLALADRTTVVELRRFLRAVIQADEYGIAVADMLRTQAIELRLKRRQRAEEKAMKITVKVIFPLMLLHSARVVHGAARASRAGHDESIQRHVSGHNDECNAIERGTRGRCLVCCALTRCIKAFLGVAALHYLRSAPLRVPASRWPAVPVVDTGDPYRFTKLRVERYAHIHGGTSGCASFMPQSPRWSCTEADHAVSIVPVQRRCHRT